MDVRVRAFGGRARRGGHDLVRRAGRARRRERGGADARHRSRDRDGCRRRRRRAQPHLVRELRRASRVAAARHPAHRHGAQPRAAAAVEGRAARRRLRRLELDREDGVRGRRGDRRGERGHARRHPAQLPGARPGEGARHLQRHRRRGVASRSRIPRCWRSSGIDPARPSVVFVGRITRQKGLPYLLRAAEQLPPDVQLVLCAGAPDTPQIMAEVEGLVRGLQETRDGRRLARPAAVAARAVHRSSARRRRSSARRCTSRSASSTSRRWRAARPSSAPRPAASPRSSSTA